MAEVTVVIPTRNRRSILLRHALPSALAQRDVEIEVLVVDDGSTDGTGEALAKLGDARVRVLSHTTGRGAAAARNLGIGGAGGDWVAFLDDDDIWAPTKLSAQLRTVGDAGWSYTGVLVVDAALRATDALSTAPSADLAELLRTGNVVAGGCSTVIAKTELLRAVGGFDESLFYVEDWDLWLKLANAAPAVACPELLVATLDHGDRTLFRDRRALQRSIDDLLARTGAGRDARQRAAEWLANEHHRGGRRWTASWLYLQTALVHRSPGNLAPALGALGGQPGMRLAARALTRFARGSHLGLERRPPQVEPEWLCDVRARVGVGRLDT